MNDLITRTEEDVTALAERDTLTTDDACELLDRIDGGLKRLKTAKEALEAFLITWLPEHGNELRIGDVRYWVGAKKKVKCRNIPAAVTALYEETGGDFDAFCDCLSSNAIKYGAARKVLGGKYELHFETTEEMDLEREAPKKVLNSVNERFLK
jgi:hypothetical protein